MTDKIFRQPREIWAAQCNAAAAIRRRFGLQSALDYVVGDKLFEHAKRAETDEAWLSELPAFAAGVKELFTAEEIRVYIDHPRRSELLLSRRERFALLRTLFRN